MRSWLLVFFLGLGLGYGMARLLHAPDQVTVSGPEALVSPTPKPIISLAPSPSPAPVIVPEPPPMEAAPGVQLQQLVDQRRWEEAIALGRRLMTGRPVTDPWLSSLLEQAYAGAIRAALDQRDLAGASRLLSQADAELGQGSARLRLLAELQQIRGDLQDARMSLHQALALEPLLADVLYPQIRQLVTALAEGGQEGLSPAGRIRLLQEELVNDPGHAPYHGLLGQLFYEQGAYGEALAQLEYALQLEPGLASRLNPLISEARRRLDSPDLVEVPLEAQGQTLYVAVRINGVNEPFRFVLDTGASLTAITEGLARQLGITGWDGLPKVELITAKGKIRAPLIRLRSVALEGALLRDVQAVILPELEGSDGLLGLSFLGRFNVDIDQRESRLRLSRH